MIASRPTFSLPVAEPMIAPAAAPANAPKPDDFKALFVPVVWPVVWPVLAQPCKTNAAEIKVKPSTFFM
jgi:hypothetical protein